MGIRLDERVGSCLLRTDYDLRDTLGSGFWGKGNHTPGVCWSQGNLGPRGKQDFGWRSASSAAINPSLYAGPAGNKHPNYDIPELELDHLARPLFS